jgi:hypothetical protein
MATVAQGLQQLSFGTSYAQVGRWAATQRPPRHTDPTLQSARAAKRRTTKDPGANYWQTGAAWVEQFSPVLWNGWLATRDAKLPPQTLPRVLALDHVPYKSAADVTDKGEKTETFSVLVAYDYHQATPNASTYSSRVRLIRAYPEHTTDTYEVLVEETGLVPDVILSDSAPEIRLLVARLQRMRPGLVWVPSTWHILQRLDELLHRLDRQTKKTYKKTFDPGDLEARVSTGEAMYGPKNWTRWWDDLRRRLASQGFPAQAFPKKMHDAQFDDVLTGLAFLQAHPQVPRGTGSLEADIRNRVKPFFASRAERFTNLERLNRATDLLTLRING